MAGNNDILPIYNLILYHWCASVGPWRKSVGTVQIFGMLLLRIPHGSIMSPTHRQRYTSFVTVESEVAEGRSPVKTTVTGERRKIHLLYIEHYQHTERPSIFIYKCNYGQQAISKTLPNREKPYLPCRSTKMSKPSRSSPPPEQVQLRRGKRIEAINNKVLPSPWVVTKSTLTNLPLWPSRSISDS